MGFYIFFTFVLHIDAALAVYVRWCARLLMQRERCRISEKMASYFDEHNCEPTNPDDQYRQNALLELAR